MARTRITTTALMLVTTLGAASAVEAQNRRAAPPADAAIEREGRIPGLGKIKGRIGWDSSQQLVLSGGEFEIDRSLDPLTRESTIRISGTGEATLTIRLGGPEGLVIQRGSHTVRGTGDVQAIRQVLGGRAVLALREQLGSFERRLVFEPSKRDDDPHAYGFLLVGALISALDGDPTAFGRTRDLIVRRARGRLRQARFDFRNCVEDYERFLLQIDTDRTNCLEAANGRSAWYLRAADRLACEVEFMANALSGEGQFISCTALGTVIAQ